MFYGVHGGKGTNPFTGFSKRQGGCEIPQKSDSTTDKSQYTKGSQKRWAGLCFHGSVLRYIAKVKQKQFSGAFSHEGFISVYQFILSHTEWVKSCSMEICILPSGNSTECILRESVSCK